MNTIRVVGIDISKSVFQVCVCMVDGSIALNKKISRSKLLDCVRHFEPGTLIAIGHALLRTYGAEPPERWDTTSD